MNTKVISEGYVVRNNTYLNQYFNRQTLYCAGNPTVFMQKSAAMKVAGKHSGTVIKAVVVVVDDTYVEPMGS